MTQRELADSLKISLKSVSNYESNKQEPKHDVITMYSHFFGVSCDYILGVRNE